MSSPQKDRCYWQAKLPALNIFYYLNLSSTLLDFYHKYTYYCTGNIFFWYQKNSWVVSQCFITNYPQAWNLLTKKSLLSWIVSLSWELEKACLGLFQCLLRLPSRCLGLWSPRRLEYLPPRQVSQKSIGRVIVFCWQEVSVHQKKRFFMVLSSHLGTA